MLLSGSEAGERDSGERECKRGLAAGKEHTTNSFRSTWGLSLKDSRGAGEEPLLPWEKTVYRQMECILTARRRRR